MILRKHDTPFPVQPRNGKPLFCNQAAWFCTSFNSYSFAFASTDENTWFEVSGWLKNWEYTEMAGRTRYGTEFVNLRLSLEQKPQFEVWAKENQDDLFNYLVNMVADGYKISINLDANNDCIIVAVTGTDNNRTNRGRCMTSRSHDAIEALLMAIFKHVVLCDGGDWGEGENKASDWG
jgi:hypothetical protein